MSIVLEFQKPPGKPLLRGNDHYWDVIQKLDDAGPWTVYDIDQRSRVSQRSTIADFVNRLVKGGIAEATGETVRHHTSDAPTFRLLSRPLRTPSISRDGKVSLQGRGQLHMWNLMRGPMGRTAFGFAEVVLYASTDDVTISKETAKKYIQRLLEAGYLICVSKGGARKPAQYKLSPAMNTGPLPPLILRTHTVYDQNRKSVVGSCLAEEVSP